MISFFRAIEIISSVFRAAGANDTASNALAELFTETEAMGTVSHGWGLVEKYAPLISAKTINDEPKIKVLMRHNSLLKIDGDHGLGVLVIDKSLDEAIKVAKETGFAFVEITNVQHYAAGEFYIKKAIENNMIIVMTATAPTIMAPYGGTKKLFGTNPFTFASPMGSLPPYVLDMASTVKAGNKLENEANLGHSVPYGWGVDRNGKESTDPNEILSNGMLLPFGGYKGSGIAGMINIVSGILSGGAYNGGIRALCRTHDKPANIGVTIELIDISRFIDVNEYNLKAEELGKAILSNPPADGFEGVVYPGYKEFFSLQKAKLEGFSPSQEGLRAVKIASRKLGLDFPELEDAQYGVERSTSFF